MRRNRSLESKYFPSGSFDITLGSYQSRMTSFTNIKRTPRKLGDVAKAIKLNTAIYKCKRAVN